MTIKLLNRGAEGELLENRHDTQRVDYGWLWNTRFALLRKAFNGEL